MKRHICEIALAVALSFFAAGVGGMVIEVIFHPAQPFWVSFWIAIFGLIASLIIIFRNQLYAAYKYLKSVILLVWRVITHIKEANKLLIINDGQKGNEGNYLHLVLQSMEVCHDDSYNSYAAVKFQLVSGLLYEFKTHQMWIIPSINGCDILDEEEKFEIKPTPNLLPLGCSQIISKAVPIKKEWVRKEIEDAKRTGAKINSQLRIEMETKDGKPIILS